MPFSGEGQPNYEKREEISEEEKEKTTAPLEEESRAMGEARRREELEVPMRKAREMLDIITGKMVEGTEITNSGKLTIIFRGDIRLTLWLDTGDHQIPVDSAIEIDKTQ